MNSDFICEKGNNKENEDENIFLSLQIYFEQKHQVEINKLRTQELYTTIPKQMVHLPSHCYNPTIRGLQKLSKGLNILEIPKTIYDGVDTDNYISSSGFKFTTIDKIHKHFSGRDYICSITIPFDDPKCKVSKLSFSDDGTTNMMIINEIYDIPDPSIYEKFGIPMISVFHAAGRGYISILKWWKENRYNELIKILEENYRYAQDFYVFSEEENKQLDIDMLIKQTTLDRASESGHVNVLQWWKESGLPMYYTAKSMDYATFQRQYTVLDWWKNSGLPLKYSKEGLVIASAHGNTKMLDWWKDSGLKLIYDEEPMDIASKNGHTNALQWWLDSGLELKYSMKAMDDASDNYRTNVLDWWKKSGLPLKYTIYKKIYSYFFNK